MGATQNLTMRHKLVIHFREVASASPYPYWTQLIKYELFMLFDNKNVS